MTRSLFDSEYEWDPREERGADMWLDAGYRFDDNLQIWRPSETPHFAPSELACRCCNRVRMLHEVVDFLEMCRQAMDKPLRITSGYRCPVHNSKVGGAPRSAHLYGAAVDVAVSGADAMMFIEFAAADDRIGGIGVMQRGPVAGRFIHVDALPFPSPSHPRPNVWSY